MTTPSQTFCAAIELSVERWKMAFRFSGQRRMATVRAGDWSAFDAEVAKTRVRFEMPASTQLSTCFEAGRDGFWIHRELLNKGIDNIVIDAASIEVPRHARNAKTDALDAAALAEKLERHLRGDKVWRVVRVPTVSDEDARRIPRERSRLIQERTGHISRLKSLLALFGLKLSNVRNLTQLEGRLPEHHRKEAQRELERLKLVDEQLKKLADECETAVENRQLPSAQKIELLQNLKAVGPITAVVLVSEMFGWRKFKNGKQVASCAGLAPSPFSSGDGEREQGISKAGNKRVRTICTEVAWLWLRYQPQTALSEWFNTRYAKGGKRSRRLGITALARKLLVALWRYVEAGVVPQGALMKE